VVISTGRRCGSAPFCGCGKRLDGGDAGNDFQFEATLPLSRTALEMRSALS